MSLYDDILVELAKQEPNLKALYSKWKDANYFDMLGVDTDTIQVTIVVKHSKFIEDLEKVASKYAENSNISADLEPLVILLDKAANNLTDPVKRSEYIANLITKEQQFASSAPGNRLK